MVDLDVTPLVIEVVVGVIPLEITLDDATTVPQVSVGVVDPIIVETSIPGVRGEAGLAGAAGPSDHGLLSGLLDDDHSQYHDDTRGDVRYYTKTQANALLAAKEASITAGTTAQYWRGDKTFQPVLGLPISTATQTALNLKEDVANKDTDVNFSANSDTRYPSQKATKTYMNNIYAALDAIKENTANKAVDFSVIDDTKFPTTKAANTQSIVNALVFG